MSVENPWSEIDELHRLRQEIAAEHHYDVFEITLAARKRMEVAANLNALVVPPREPTLTPEASGTILPPTQSSP